MNNENGVITSFTLLSVDIAVRVEEVMFLFISAWLLCVIELMALGYHITMLDVLNAQGEVKIKVISEGKARVIIERGKP